MELKYILLFIIIGTICFSVGYYIGYISGLNWCVEKAVFFLNLKGYSIDVNTAVISAALYQYKNNIGGFINCDYALVHNNSGNKTLFR